MMTIKCPKCRKGYKIKEDKLPAGKLVAVPCPNCNSKIPIDLRGKTETKGYQKPAPRQTVSRKESAENAQELPTGNELKTKIIKSISELPPMPQVISKAQDVMADSSKGMKDLSSVLETDPAIVASVLKLANSAYFGLSGKVATIQQASVLLGAETLKEVIMSAGVSSLLGARLLGYGYESGDLWKHSVSVGIGAKMIASKIAPAYTDEAYLTGLIHDAGKMMLDPHILQRKDEFAAHMANEDTTFLEAERHIFGFDHSEIAFDVCKKWNIPVTVAQGVKYHHQPSLSNGSKLAYIAHMADSISRSGGLGVGADDFLYSMEEGTLEFLNMGQEAVMALTAQVISEMLKFEG